MFFNFDQVRMFHTHSMVIVEADAMSRQMDALVQRTVREPGTRRCYLVSPARLIAATRREPSPTNLGGVPELVSREANNRARDRSSSHTRHDIAGLCEDKFCSWMRQSIDATGC
jgi:hypothetical protein